MGHEEPGVYFRRRFQRLLTHAAEKLFSIHVISKNEPLFHSPDDDGVQGPLPTQPGSPWDYSPANLVIRIPFLLNLVNAVPISTALFGAQAKSERILGITPRRIPFGNSCKPAPSFLQAVSMRFCTRLPLAREENVAILLYLVNPVPLFSGSSKL